MKRPSITGFVLTALLCNAMFTHSTFADTLLQSGAERVSLLELYTSEGCNSCPPADKWLTGLTTHPDLWDRLIPLAFHVDYWNDLGWQDRFSQAAFSNRQHRYADLGGLRFVYTPGFVLDGQEWNGYRDGRIPAGDRAEAGSLVVRIREHDVVVDYRPLTSVTDVPLTVNLALLGFGLTSEIRAGENQGRLLQHDFVVTDLIRKSLTDENGVYATITPRPQSDVSADRYALAVWVSAGDEQAPLQAVGGWLDSDTKSVKSTQATNHAVALEEQRSK